MTNTNPQTSGTPKLEDLVSSSTSPAASVRLGLSPGGIAASSALHIIGTTEYLTFDLVADGGEAPIGHGRLRLSEVSIASLVRSGVLPAGEPDCLEAILALEASASTALRKKIEVALQGTQAVGHLEPRPALRLPVVETKAHSVDDLARLTAVVERYEAMLARTELPELSDAEWSFLRDMTCGSYLDLHYAEGLDYELEDAIALGGLNEKWDVDGASLLAKVQALSAPQRIVVLERIEHWWAGAT